jgi:hypothetical protein
MLNSNVVQIVLVGSDYPEVCSLLEKRAVLLSQLQRDRSKTLGATHPNSAELEQIDARIVEIVGRTALCAWTPS